MCVPVTDDQVLLLIKKATVHVAVGIIGTHASACQKNVALASNCWRNDLDVNLGVFLIGSIDKKSIFDRVDQYVASQKISARLPAWLSLGLFMVWVKPLPAQTNPRKWV